MLQAGAAVAQDLGFLIEESSVGSGMLLASKKREAVDQGQRATEMLLVLLAAFSKSRYQASFDTDQRIRLSFTTRAEPGGSGLIVRVSFQRVIYDQNGRAKVAETVEDPLIYQEFFEKLNQASFLQAQDI